MDLVDLTIDVIAIVAGIGLSVYSYKLFRFFKKGIFEKPFKILSVAALIFAFGCLIDTIEAVHEYVYWEYTQDIIRISFVVITLYALSGLYKSWKAIGKTPDAAKQQ
jgi:hypothetical protein